jgi:hypothetical protein
VDTEEARCWLVMLIELWNDDAVVRREFDSLFDFCLWVEEESERLINSALWVE